MFRFIITGSSAVGTDYLTYYILSKGLDTSLAKGISFLAGTVLAFVLNKYWTFRSGKYSLVEIFKFIGLYCGSLLVNILVNEMVLLLYENWIFMAFIFATGTSTIINFIGQKWWVFKSDEVKYNSSMLQ